MAALENFLANLASCQKMVSQSQGIAVIPFVRGAGVVWGADSKPPSPRGLILQKKVFIFRR